MQIRICTPPSRLSRQSVGDEPFLVARLDKHASRTKDVFTAFYKFDIICTDFIASLLIEYGCVS